MLNITKRETETGFYTIGYDYYDYDCEKRRSEERRRYKTSEAAERAINRKKVPSIYSITFYKPEYCKEVYEWEQQFKNNPAGAGV